MIPMAIVNLPLIPDQWKLITPSIQYLLRQTHRSAVCLFYSPLSPSDPNSIGIAFRKPLAPSAEHVAISRSNISVAQGNSFMATSTLIFHWQFVLQRRPAATIQQGDTDSRATSNSEIFCSRSQNMLSSPAMQAVAVDHSEASM